VLSPSDVAACHGRGRRPGCGALIRWTTTEAGRLLAVDADPHTDGNTAIMRDAAGVLRSRRVSAERPLQPWEHLMMPHAATCGPQKPLRPQGVTPIPPRVHGDLQADHSPAHDPLMTFRRRPRSR
jgi:hypothetical protein